MNQSEQINELAAALAKAQSEIQPAIKDSTNPFFKSKYADLSSVWSACKTPLTKNGLSVLQTMEPRDGQLTLVTTLAHSSGQWIRSFLPIISQKQDAQSIGSAITYMRRYSLAALVGVTTDEDDDGNAAVSAPTKHELITKAEADELESMIGECSNELVANIRKYLKSNGYHSTQQLPRQLYLSVKKRIDQELSMEREAVNA
jgi:hypothetical protein